MSTGSVLEIKGIKNGLLVHLDPAREWKSFVEQLMARIEQQQSFFKGARVALEVGERTVRRQDLGALQKRLKEHGIDLWAVLSDSVTTVATARKLGLQTSLDDPEKRGKEVQAEAAPEVSPHAADLLREDDTPPIDPEEAGSGGVLVKRTLRSGRRVRSDGHVVVLGDVNPGAEIVAGGDVIVWGRLRGVVHAGASGDSSAFVCALDMTPMQLRIAGHIATSPAEKRREAKPEVARIRDDRIVVEVWNWGTQ